jgi:hypothetical protein
MLSGTASFRRTLLRRQDGTAVMEFGLIAPVFFLLLLGTCDLAHTAYAHAVFAGAVERAARDSSLETADTSAADQSIEDSIAPVLPGAVVTTQRKSYFDFSDIDRPEQFTDVNGNDICDNGESYVDENNSGRWESDVGSAGNGGASDVVSYTATVRYEPLFRVPFMPSAWTERTITASAVKKNQPFGNQQALGTTAGTCP